ncbi:unnamed protein product, partial [Closterium sp. NIES-53]
MSPHPVPRSPPSTRGSKCRHHGLEVSVASESEAVDAAVARATGIHGPGDYCSGLLQRISLRLFLEKTASDGTPCSTVKNTDCAKPKGFFRRRQPSQEEIRVCNEKRVIQILQCGGGAS